MIQLTDKSREILSFIRSSEKKTQPEIMTFVVEKGYYLRTEEHKARTWLGSVLRRLKSLEFIDLIATKDEKGQILNTWGYKR